MKIEQKLGTRFTIKSESIAEVEYLKLLSEKLDGSPLHRVMVDSCMQGADDEEESEAVWLTLSFYPSKK